MPNTTTHPNDGLAHINTWVFDLDNTLYPRSCDLFSQIDVKMTDFVAELLKTDDRLAARKVQKDLFRSHGTTLRGLMEEHHIDPIAFLDFVHDIDYSPIPISPALESALDRLPGRKLVFTNGDVPHAERTLEKLGVSHHFEAIFDIVAADLVPKPNAAPYETFLHRHDIDASKAVMFEDMARNLEVPKAKGMATVLVQSDAPGLGEAWEHEGHDLPYIDHRTTDLAGFLTSLSA